MGVCRNPCGGHPHARSAGSGIQSARPSRHYLRGAHPIWLYEWHRFGTVGARTPAQEFRGAPPACANRGSIIHAGCTLHPSCGVMIELAATQDSVANRRVPVAELRHAGWYIQWRGRPRRGMADSFAGRTDSAASKDLYLSNNTLERGNRRKQYNVTGADRALVLKPAGSCSRARRVSPERYVDARLTGQGLCRLSGYGHRYGALRATVPIFLLSQTM